ncbi:MAG: hypothetical protein Q8Q39_01485 [bacterium]|nr:hypothetical protein [bacterium]
MTKIKIVSATLLIALGLVFGGCRTEINAGAKTSSDVITKTASANEAAYRIEVIDDTRLYTVHINPLNRASISSNEYILANGLRELVRRGYTIRNTEPIIGRWGYSSPTAALLVYVEPKDKSRIPPIAPSPPLP